MAVLAGRTATFVREVVMPVEESCGAVARSEPVRTELQAAAKAASVFVLHVGVDFGGARAGHARSRGGVRGGRLRTARPLALNIAAPDEGNMHMLEAIATDEQKACYLAPLAAGGARFCSR